MQRAAPHPLTVKMKICLVGDFAVGKTSVVRRFVYDTFDDRYVATLGAKVTKKELEVEMPHSRQRGHADLTVWDIMGSEGFREPLKEAYFRGSQGILAVCDVTRPETLLDLKDWRKSVEKVAGTIPATVLANKVDLTGEARFQGGDLEAFCKEWEGCPHLFTSAKTGEGVEEAFRRLTELVLEARLGRSEGSPASGPLMERMV